MIRAFALTTVATMALAACASRSGTVPSPLSAMNPTTARTSPLALKTCATRPPQHEWVFKGACQKFHLTSTGGHFRLDDYQGITVKGLVGQNNAKRTLKFVLADAIDQNGDIKMYKRKAFPPYKAQGTTYFYAAAVNQSTQVFKPIMVKGKPVLQYTVTNANGFGDANVCGAAVLTFKGSNTFWKTLPATGLVKGKTVTISEYAAPTGFELVPKIPFYVATNCYKQ